MIHLWVEHILLAKKCQKDWTQVLKKKLSPLLVVNILIIILQCHTVNIYNKLTIIVHLVKNRNKILYSFKCCDILGISIEFKLSWIYANTCTSK